MKRTAKQIHQDILNSKPLLLSIIHNNTSSNEKAQSGVFRRMNCWTVVVWINVMFLSAVWTLILTAPIHCRAYDVMLHFSKSVLLKKLIPILSGRRMSTFWANVPLSHIQPLLSDGKRQHHQLHTYISDTQDPFCPVLCQDLHLHLFI